MERDVTAPRTGATGGGLLETVLLALSVTGIWYLCYYLAAPWIWSQNIPFRPEDITPWIRTSTDEHDGVEIYALYLLVFCNLASAFSLSRLLERFGTQRAHRAALWVCGAGTVAFCAAVRFIPPMQTASGSGIGLAFGQSLMILLVVAPLLGILYFLQRVSPRLAALGGALLLLPACFLAISNMGWRDYTYIFAPAQRLLDGALPSEIYFQYDLLPSLLAAAWMKLGWDLNDFRILGQIAYYLAILGVFLLSRRLFVKQELSILLLVALILARLYATPYDITLVFQVTPVRLDLWLPLLLLVYRLGPFHWSAGFCCALLLLLGKNFGIIYSAAYLQFLIALCALDYLDARGSTPPGTALAGYLRRCALPVLFIAVGFVASSLLFRNLEYGDFAGYYRKIGIGFIQIARTSFYWYVPALFSTAGILLFRLRKELPERYLNAGLLLLFCAVGNSIYFFGRSHEHNILNLAIILVFTFFLVLDLAARSLDLGDGAADLPAALRRYSVEAVSLLFILVVVVSYSENIAKRGYIQATNVANGKIAYSGMTLPENFQGYLGRMRELTGTSRKIFFVDQADFAFYYYGGYDQSGYCNPFLTWIFTKDLTRYLQKLLDQGYYLVCNPDLKYLLEPLKYDSTQMLGDTIIASKKSAIH